MGRSIYQVNEGVLERPTISKRLIAGAMAFLFAGSIFTAFSASASSVTPSTNEENMNNNWAYVEVTPEEEQATLKFTSTRDFDSCFEYRTDGDATQANGVNENTRFDDLYPYVCVSNEVEEVTVDADSYVEVRLVFGAESDERFDWTNFNVLNTKAPATPTGLHRVAASDDELLSCDEVTTRQTLYPTWDENGESDFSHYEYTSINSNGTIGLNEVELNTNQFIHNWTPQTDGTNGFQVRAVDTAGNVSEWSEVCHITYDAKAPVANLTVAPSDTNNVSGVLTVMGSVDDAEENIKSHWFEVKGPEGYAEYFYNMNTDELSWSFDWDTTEVHNGEYTIRYVATDQAGNSNDVSGGETITLNVRNVAETKSDCKNGTWNLLGFKNQGQCIASIQSNENSRHRR